MTLTVVALSCAARAAADGAVRLDASRIHTLTSAIRPLCQPLEKPAPNDWLAQHEEPGQSFRQYLRSRPVTIRGDRTVIYVQPLGELDGAHRGIVHETARFLSQFYGCAVVTLDPLALDVVPDTARRTHAWGGEQLLTTYILDEVLRPRLPDDAVAFIAFTSSDLWPGKGWNFVFGQARLRQRVGVWSLNRFGDPAESEDARLLCLRRTLKLAVHETGHMFSMLHCTAYQCGMCGSNHLQETDRRPLHFCVECMAKVCWATQADPLRRAQTLESTLRELGLTGDADFYRKAAERMTHAAGKAAPNHPPDTSR